MTVFAKKDEWVVDKAGKRVCRVLRDIHWGESISHEPFGDWQIPKPKIGEILPDGFRTRLLTAERDIRLEGVGWASERA